MAVKGKVAQGPLAPGRNSDFFFVQILKFQHVDLSLPLIKFGIKQPQPDRKVFLVDYAAEVFKQK